MQKFPWFVCACLFVMLLPAVAPAQISESEILSLLAANDLTTARARVQEARRQSPNSALVAYYSAFLEENAETALPKFQELIKKFSSSEYAVRAQYRVGQYYFARGSYHRAREAYLALAQAHPGSPLAATAEYHAAKALAILGENAQAREELTAFVEKYPEAPMTAFAREDLESLPKAPPAKTERKTKSPKISYTVQTGAFTQKSNAVSQQKIFNKAGYKTEINEKRDGNKKYYAVWVGKFSSREDARAFADKLNRKHKVKGSVVQRED